MVETFLESIGLLKFFLPVFTFLLIFVICYALLTKTKIFGEKSSNLNLIASFAVAVLFLFTPEAIELINFVTPWFVVFVVFLLFISMTFMFLGTKEETFTEILKLPKVYWTIIIGIMIIFFLSLTKIYGPVIQSFTQSGTNGDVTGAIGQVVFSPKILGAILLLVIASQAVRLIASK